MKKDKKNLLRVLHGKASDQVPIWLMRQAGRYLPEYKILRGQAGSFMKLVLNPGLAAEVTLQPVKRFGVDGAILFSDILIVPFGLGQELEFVEGEGPKLEKLTDRIPYFEEKTFYARTQPVYETVARVAMEMPANTTLIGFCGAAWTVSCYLLGSSKNHFSDAQEKAAKDRLFFIRLLDNLVEASIFYLEKQIAAGAECVQIFDSHAGLVGEGDIDDFIIAPTKKIISGVRRNHPGFPVIGFPRGLKKEYLPRYASETGASCVSLDTDTDLLWAQKNIPAILQGNLDPGLMTGEEAPMLQAAEQILKTMEKPFIFNLGHGLTPEARPDNVAALTRFVQGFRA